MPATETTWRDQKVLHVAFGVSSLVMLIGTIWMLAVDHRREWKHYQQQFRGVETWAINARKSQVDNIAYQQKSDVLQSALDRALVEVPDADDVNNFLDLIKDHEEDEKAKKDAGSVAASGDLPKQGEIVDAYNRLKAAPQDARKAARSDLVELLNKHVAAAKFHEENELSRKKFKAADYDVARSQYDQGVGEERSPDAMKPLEANVKQIGEQLSDLTVAAQNATVYRKSLEATLGQINNEETEARKALDDHKQQITRLVKAMQEREYNIYKKFVDLPIIDAFNAPSKVDNQWLPKLTYNNNFRDVARFDRCATCHQGIDKTAPGQPTEPGFFRLAIIERTLPTPAEVPKPNLDARLFSVFGLTLAEKEPVKVDAVQGDSRGDYAGIKVGDVIEKVGDHAIVKRGDALKYLVDDVGWGSKLWLTVRRGPQSESVKLVAPAEPPVLEERLSQVFGLELAQKGVLVDDDATISVVRPESAGAKAMIEVGDVIDRVGDARILNRQQALAYLADTVEWGKPLALTIRRGFKHPYSSHPRLDLFVSDASPHKKAVMGCTICHDGQGSGTDFKFTSHAPNTPRQANEWKQEHGWFNDHNWLFPMEPKRFAESTCLKCHHNVTELEPSERFPEDPAPKLMAGYNLIRQFGCYGCHDINGFDGPYKRIGPDMRAEPNYAPAAEALLADKNLSAAQQALARAVIADPEDDHSRRSLGESIQNAMNPAADGQSATPKFSASARKLAGVLDDLETPGKLRKVGPSLRHVASKLDFDFLYSWIKNPTDFRPTTRMPRFFGLHEHLGHQGDQGFDEAEKFEPIEIRAITTYLLDRSQPFEYAELDKNVARPSAERGKLTFETRGCLACHVHKDFPGSSMTQGPDLSRLRGKFGRDENKNGGDWLYTWLKNPSHYSPRTLMPNLLLEPIDTEGKLADPAADMTAFLLTGEDWKPRQVSDKLSNEEKTALDELALEYLKGAAASKRIAENMLKKGVPEAQRSELKGDEVELIGPPTDKSHLLYVGRRSLSKYGCSGCHDIPGFEDVKPIGTGLADWGRKESDKLAFEQIVEYIKEKHGEHPGEATESKPGKKPSLDDEALLHMRFGDMSNQTEAFFMQKLFSHSREGFLWQKLHEPRSFDFKKTENKGYNERLRMPQFKLTDEQIEQIMTFVLGLVAEPPGHEAYVYHAPPRRQAAIDGLRVAEKFNCTGCHVFKMERWKLAFPPDQFAAPNQVQDLSKPTAHFSVKEIASSAKPDTRGLFHAVVSGMPATKAETGLPIEYDSEGDLIEEAGVPVAKTKFTLWDNVLLAGKTYDAGISDIEIPTSTIEDRYEAVGGFLPRLILRPVFQQELKVNPKADASVVWGWLPPPLVGEGRKVQTSWLHDFLLDPYPIRPSAVLRMPKFNMSPSEATTLAHYFAAVDDADYPFDLDPRTQESYLASEDAKHPHRLGDALKIVTDTKNSCTQCHLIGDFVPSGSDKALAPRLDQVYKRLRPEFLQQWIANPKRILPYTGMPMNFDPANPKPIFKQLFGSGDVKDQFEAVVDLLLNYDRYSAEQRSMKKLIDSANPATAPAAANESPAAVGPGVATRERPTGGP